LSEGQRRLAAIMFTDIVGYTRLAQTDEALAMELLDEHRRLLRPCFAKQHGTVVKTIGDGFMVEFGSALEAVRCAVEIQSMLREANISRTGERRIRVRIGIHLGDLIHRETDVEGDTVNIAARIEPLAVPGGICVSRQVRDSVLNKTELHFESLGTPELKYVTAPVEVFRISGFGEYAARPVLQRVRNRVAVLPFLNMSQDANDEYFADGMTEELIYRLAKVRALDVIARTSIMGYKKTDKKASEIAAELQVGKLIEGSVRKAGNRVRVTVQLIEAGTEEHLWASQFDKDLDDLFTVQSQISTMVASQLKVRLLDSERRKLEKKPTKSTEAYDDFLRGVELYRKESEASVRKAVDLFAEAIKLDSSFARAYVGLANCDLWLAELGLEPREVSLSRAQSLLQSALELDRDLPEAHASLSELFMNEGGAEQQAASEAGRAVELNPSLPDPYYLLSEQAGSRGEADEMVRLIEKAYRLDPLRPLFISLLGQEYFWTGREQEALVHWKKTEHLAPQGTYQAMAVYYLSKLNFEKAKEYHAKVERLDPKRPWVTWMAGCISALEGDMERARLTIRKIEDSNMGPIGFNYIAFVYHALGDLDSYFDYINRALQAGSLIGSVIMFSPLLARARSDPRYQLFKNDILLRTRNTLT
jgi:adenylate cyclase